MTANAYAASPISKQGAGSPDSEIKLAIVPSSPDLKQAIPLPRIRNTAYRDYTFEIGVSLAVLLGVSLVAGGIHLINNRLRG